MSILDNNVITVSSRAANRVLSIPVEFINYQQFGSLYKYETAKGSGVALSIKIGNSYQWCMVSRTGLVSWWTQQDALVGSGPSRESEQLFITSSSILKPHGNAATVLGVISGVVQKDPETSVVIRYVTMVSDNSGFNQSCAVRNSVVTVATSTRPSTVVPIVGTSTWGSVNYQDPEDITTRMEYNERTQDFAIEIAADEAGSKLGVINRDGITTTQRWFRMSITNGQVITESDLTTAFNAQINTLSTDATSSFGFSQINMDLQDVLASTDVNARTYEFIAVDDCKLSEIAVYVGEGSGVWTIRISSPNLADDIVLSETVGSAAYNFRGGMPHQINVSSSTKAQPIRLSSRPHRPQEVNVPSIFGCRQ